MNMERHCLWIVCCLTLSALISSVMSQGCTKTCPHKGYLSTPLKAGECACSPGYPGPYKKGALCTMRLSVNNHMRIRLEAPVFKIRQSKQGHREYLLFENMINKKMNKINKKNKGGYYMKKIWNRSQMTKNQYIIVNSPQIRMKFRASAKGSLKGKKWKVCLKETISPNLDKLECPFTMDNMQKGFNRRHADISSNETHVVEFCCKSSSFNMKTDESFVMCEEDGYPRNELTENGKDACVVCSSSKERVAVQADITSPSSSKKVDCTCKVRGGASIGEDCTGGVPCLDLNHNAYCDEAGSNTCKCPSGMVADTANTKCGPPAKIGEDCSSGQVCSTTYKRGYCDGSVCVCPATEAADATNSYCTKEVAIGAACLEGYTCTDSLSRATCVSDVCKCPSGASADTGNAYCTYKSNYKGFCTDTLDCVQTRSKSCNTATKKCVCESGFGDLNGFCSYRSIYGGQCDTVKDCLLSNSVCSGSKCLCKTWYQKKSNTVCSLYCKTKTGKRFDQNKFVCNNYKPQKKCYKCKCAGVNNKWTTTKISSKEYKSSKNPCYTKLKSQCNGITKIIITSSKCGNS